jgi:predicted ATPase with chaperone activity
MFAQPRDVVREGLVSLGFVSTPVDPANVQPPRAPHLPPMIMTSCGWAPQAPNTIEETGLDEWILNDLAIKLTATVPHLSTEWAADRLRLPTTLVEKIFWQLKQDQLIEILGQTGEFGYRYAATDRGRERARRSMEVSGYVGPAPVSLNAYSAMLDWQSRQRPKAAFDAVRQAIAPLVLPDATIEVAALAAQSSRSLFLFGPPGNGKTSLGRLLHSAVQGELWIPFCFCIESNMVRVYDRQIHKPIDAIDNGEETPVLSAFDSGKTDRRWIRIKPPFVVAGGEMTMAELDLAYSPSLRYYEAPPHLKANGGTFLIDDFGRQRIEPHELLNRWIIPLESQIDHLTLAAGQKIEVPFRLMLIVATNLAVSDVADPAFLRRMGYRVHIKTPDPRTYRRIFENYAAKANVTVAPGLIDELFNRYRAESRELRGSEPRDLIERAREVCELRQQPFTLTSEVLNTAWLAYFGDPSESPPLH